MSELKTGKNQIQNNIKKALESGSIVKRNRELDNKIWNSARKYEQDRIIYILRNEWLPIADVEACIALIKGETK